MGGSDWLPMTSLEVKAKTTRPGFSALQACPCAPAHPRRRPRPREFTREHFPCVPAAPGPHHCARGWQPAVGGGALGTESS